MSLFPPRPSWRWGSLGLMALSLTAGCGAATPVAQTVVTTDLRTTTETVLTTSVSTVTATATTTLNPEEAAAYEASQAAAALASAQDASVSAALADDWVFYSVHCKVGDSFLTFDTYQQAWASTTPTTSCEDEAKFGTNYTDQQKQAVAAAGGGTDMKRLETLYGLCGARDGYYVNPTNPLSDGQSVEARAMLLLCPDHPNAAAIEANAGAKDAAAAAAASLVAADQARLDSKKYAPEGKYLVGEDILPGVWRSEGDKVTDCYWELADAKGEIIDNNFISVAPQLTITIPADAAGFTVTGCSFEWVSG